MMVSRWISIESYGCPLSDFSPGAAHGAWLPAPLRKIFNKIMKEVINYCQNTITLLFG